MNLKTGVAYFSLLKSNRLCAIHSLIAARPPLLYFRSESQPPPLCQRSEARQSCSVPPFHIGQTEMSIRTPLSHLFTRHSVGSTIPEIPAYRGSRGINQVNYPQHSFGSK